MHKTLLIGACLLLAGAAQAGEPVAGESLYKTKGCIGCHGPGGKSANPGAFPTLAGKDAEHLKTQLLAFKTYKRRNPMMNGMAAGLTEDEIASLSDYLAAQK